MTTFTPHQNAALNAVADWIKAKPGEGGTPQVFRLFGFAGTGKTTLARHIADGVDGDVKYAAFTGKAALVMRSRGCDGASTIHSLIYRAREIRRGAAEFRIMGRCPRIQGQADRDRRVLDGRCRARPRPSVIRRAATGAGRSAAQLPPIQGGGFFTEAEPDAMLTEVHRQAQDDPIVRMSMAVREGRSLELGQFGEQRGDQPCQPRSRPCDAGRSDPGSAATHTRRAYNMRVRQKQGIEDPLPVAGDKLVCLRNNRKKVLFNGGLWRVKARAHVQIPDRHHAADAG